MIWMSFPVKRSQKFPKNLPIRVKLLQDIKVGCVFPMVVVSILPHAEFGQNDHREDAPHFSNE